MFGSSHIGHMACVSSQMMQSLVVIPVNRSCWHEDTIVNALVCCTSERSCTGTWAHMFAVIHGHISHTVCQLNQSALQHVVHDLYPQSGPDILRCYLSAQLYDVNLAMICQLSLVATCWQHFVCCQLSCSSLARLSAQLHPFSSALWHLSWNL